MTASRTRIDQLLTSRCIAPSRSRARDMLSRNCVTVDGKPVSKAGTLVTNSVEISVSDPALNYVSRAALKLIAGLDAANFPVVGHHALDLGASTGGFTQVLLERGAASVLAIDVGHGQMAPQIEANPRVTSLENFNGRALTSEDLITSPTLIVSDVSFVSLTLAAEPALRLTAPIAFAVLLIKPQFEVGKDGIGKGGLVKSPELANQAVDRICDWFTTLPGWEITKLIPSPIHGGDGNQEFLLCGSRRA